MALFERKVEQEDDMVAGDAATRALSATAVENDFVEAVYDKLAKVYDLKFADDAFDIVYAPYLISVVPDPIKVACEMRRVCRPGGRIIFLNHFLSPNPILSRVERLLSPATIHIGFKSDLDLPAFLAQADLKPVS